MFKTFTYSGNLYHWIDLPDYAGENLSKLPFSLRILLENVLRQSVIADDEDLFTSATDIINWQPNDQHRSSIPFQPSRVLLQDLTGVPLLTDLAAMRSEKARMGADPKSIKPIIPVDLVIDHSLQVDFHKNPNPLERNMALEYQRNRERYQLLRWAQDVLPGFRVVPPGKGIVHQINLEHLATVVSRREFNDQTLIYPDTVFGTDSHTPMINGLGVLGWGVGGIEAIAAMLGKPSELVLPDVIGLRLHGRLSQKATPTDLTLRIVEMLRQEGVVGKFIEIFGEGLQSISIPDRAMIANMSPETGATAIYFPIDNEVLAYLKLTGRQFSDVKLVENYYRRQNLFRNSMTRNPVFTKEINIDLSKIKTSLAGPFRPQDRIEIGHLKHNLSGLLNKNQLKQGFSVPEEKINEKVTIKLDNKTVTLQHGSLLIAAITSCTNTSNPMVMLAAGLLAKKAVDLGLGVSPAIKCSLMPGSQVVTAYLSAAGLLEPLAKLGFHLVGYGCGTCIGNSGPLAPEIETALKKHPLITASISSGNRNFEGRIHPLTRANYLASPPLVVAYAIAGNMLINLDDEPLGTSSNGEPVYLMDIYPSHQEVEQLSELIQPKLFSTVYDNIFTGDKAWQSIYSDNPSDLFKWDSTSTYIKEPPYFGNKTVIDYKENEQNITGARLLAILGDSVTTDHISPAGTIPLESPAGKYLRSIGVEQDDFNTYGARRGNDQVMRRGTFANIRLKNIMVPDREGGFTRHIPSGKKMTIFEASERYLKEKVPLIVVGGKEYGCGSSRDWAAKGPMLLGVRAIIAKSFERIHRANLIGMGILPLEFQPGEDAETLGLDGTESFTLFGLDQLSINSVCQVQVNRENGNSFTFDTIVKINTKGEIWTYLAGGILHEALDDELLH